MKSIPLFIGLYAEGTTDLRFLEPIVEKTINNIALNECRGTIDISMFRILIGKTGESFTNQVLLASSKGMNDFAMNIICVHADADADNSQNTYNNRINPSIELLKQQNSNNYCKDLIAIVPIHETEAWMLADKKLLKEQIGTEKSDTELGIARNPEIISNPKEVIEEAIRLSLQSINRKRSRKLSISELYSPIGNSIDLIELDRLKSYQDFKDNVRKVFKIFGLIN